MLHPKLNKVPIGIHATEKGFFIEEKSFEFNLIQNLGTLFGMSLDLESYHYTDVLFL